MRTLLSALMIATALGACPFNLKSSHKTQDLIMQKVWAQAAKGPLCLPPLCDSSAPLHSRRLLSRSDVQVGNNGFPTLEQATVSFALVDACDDLGLAASPTF